MLNDSGISVRAYARHRGVTHRAVQNAITKGRLVGSVGRGSRGPTIVDVILADHEWDRNTDLTRAPVRTKVREDARCRGGDMVSPPVADIQDALGSVPHGKLSIADATAEEKAWKARLSELTYREKSGALVDAREVELRTANVFTRCRTKLLGVPSKLRMALPALSRTDLLVIDATIRQALEEIALPDEQQVVS